MLNTHAQRKPVKTIILCLTAIAIAALVYTVTLSVKDSADQMPVDHERVEYVLKGRVLTLWVADTPEKRKQGLMFNESLADNTGMLFVFDKPSEQCMWMKNTPIELGVVFLDEDRNVLAEHVMAPHDLTSHCSNGPAMWAIEASPASLGLIPNDK